MRWIQLFSLLLLLQSCSGTVKTVFVEAESFKEKGGWVIDQQFMDIMGSPYLMAHGLGKPVPDASTSIEVPEGGYYRLWVRTKNWTAPFTDAQTPGIFRLLINNIEIEHTFGEGSGSWHWENGGKIKLRQGSNSIILKDLTGFNGRIDGLLLTTDKNFIPPDSLMVLYSLRREWLGLPQEPPLAGKYDLVVAGGGIAGISAAVAAARLGLKVALIQNRPVPGGNNSSEIRVWRSGKTQRGKYPSLGSIVTSLGADKTEDMKAGSTFGDSIKTALVKAEPNISLFLNYHVFDAITDGDRITAIVAKNIESGRELKFEAALFADCTGDGNLGYLAGADYRTGSELRSETGESKAPVSDTLQVLGSSLFWWSQRDESDSTFPECPWTMQFTEESCQHALQSSWNWESGFSKNMITDLEEIRDDQLRAIFGNWAFQKNKSIRKADYKDYKIAELGYIIGKRESRRLLGDIIITQQDLDNQVEYPDGCVAIDWGVDIHIADPVNSKFFPGEEFRAIALHQGKETSPLFHVPYRCLYSRNISNLLMAGRHISTTHVAHASTRVQRYTGTYGEVVGIAAAMCRKHNVNPRELYERFLNEFKAALRNGVPEKNG
jgi:hypothetical protein